MVRPQLLDGHGAHDKNVNRARRHVFHRARYSSAGRAMLAVTDVATSPRDAIQRRSAAVAYNRRHPNPQHRSPRRLRDASARRVPGTDEIIALSLRLFEEKKRKLEAAMDRTPRCTPRSGRSCAAF